MYNSWDHDALLNYHNDVYFNSPIRTSYESCFFVHIGGNESAEIHFHKFKLALLSTQVLNFSLDVH